MELEWTETRWTKKLVSGGLLTAKDEEGNKQRGAAMKLQILQETTGSHWLGIESIGRVW
ncbi:hypothetical protein ILUMI_14600, partial [Ignelater luminosus]